MDFLNWSALASHSGALAMVIIITQFTKGMGIIKKIPTQLWSYIISLVVLFPANYFTNQLTFSNFILVFFNGIIVALAANGGFTVLEKLYPKIFKNN